jgi:hypothetical protein
MSTTFSPHGTARYTQTDEQDWAAWLDYAADQQRWPRDQRTPCHNAHCDQLTEALFCSEDCREQAEGPDHDDDVEREGKSAAAETSISDRGNVGHSEGKNGHVAFPLPEAPASANVFVTLKGRQVQLTLRDTCETRLLYRLSVVLDQFPLEPSAQASTAPQTPEKGWCTIHQVAMKLNEKEGRQWYSHKVGEGWCKGRGVPHA